ncbi:hypothetical protein WICMUC_000006 [Wickerhamomyces mucosus]|uniref:Uncharacterized protein n=1 Tax=Wickerhamomyces mucosus TaxID=1378264 RepID=A0A9P8Q0L7_9ASCO|nr:hypothetical protein WICMUC_000006 [Wickerhamomyces mucosus]
MSSFKENKIQFSSQKYHEELDSLTDNILTKSSSTISKIENNLKLTYSSRLSNALIHQIDEKIGKLNSNLQEYQYYLSQLNSLLIRSEYFETQLNFLENNRISNNFNNNNEEENDFKNKSLDWIITESTLENLQLEYNYLSRKLESLNSSNVFSIPKKQFNYINDKDKFNYINDKDQFNNNSNEINSTPKFNLNNLSSSSSPCSNIKSSRKKNHFHISQDKFDESIQLKPIRCISKAQEYQDDLDCSRSSISSDRRSIDPRFSLKFNLLTQIPAKSRQNLTQSFNSSIQSQKSLFSQSSSKSRLSSNLFSYDGQIQDSPLANKNKKISTNDNGNNDKEINSNKSFGIVDIKIKRFSKHIRSSSLPKSFDFAFTPPEDSYLNDTPIKESSYKKQNREFSLRHFISHDTGLKLKNDDESFSEDAVKHSEFLNSPLSVKINNFLSQKFPTSQSQKVGNNESDIDIEIDDEDNGDNIVITHDDSVLEDDTNDNNEFSPVFEHKLNRSNSCDSIFSTMKNKVPIAPIRDNRQQTMNWMTQFSTRQNQQPITYNASTISVNNPSTRTFGIKSTTKQKLSGLVSQNLSQKSNSNGFLTNSQNALQNWLIFPKMNEPISPPPRPSALSSLNNNLIKSKKSIANMSITIPEDEVLDSSTVTKDDSSQWSSIFSRFNPSNYSSSKTLSIPKKDKFQNHSNPKVLQNSNKSFPSAERTKGSYSTLTIGPKGSKIVQHGESSGISSSYVLSSKVSHSALKDALNSELF